MTSARINRGGASDPSSGGRENRGHISLNGVLPDPLSVPTPEISTDLLRYLDLHFPDALRLVNQLGSMEAANGARAVIDHLREVHQEQQDTPHHVHGRQIRTSAAAGPGPSAAASG